MFECTMLLINSYKLRVEVLVRKTWSVLENKVMHEGYMYGKIFVKFTMRITNRIEPLRS